MDGSTTFSAPTTIKLEPYLGAQLAIRAEVNGHAGLFLFDTGEGVSTISPEFAKTIGCRPWGRITGFRMTGERLDFLRCDNLKFNTEGEVLTAPIAGVFDIMSLLPADAPHLDGSLGLDVLAGRAITFDESSRLLIIESAASLKTRIRNANAKEIPVRLVRDAEGIALEIDAAVPTPLGMAWMELDSGNGGTLVIARHVASLFHLDPDKKEPQPVKFEIAAGIPVEGAARTPDMIMDGNIGARFFTKWVLTLDLASGRAWLAPHSTA
jgi:hypothetical protein